MKETKIDRIQEFYTSLKPVKTTSLAPRRGYYFVQSVRKQLIVNTEVEVANALWKFDKKEKFDVNFRVEIQLQTLRLNSFHGSDQLLDSINNKIIHVKAAYVDFSDSSNGRFICQWEVAEPIKEDFNDDYTISADEQNLQARVESEMAKQDDVDLMIDNALLDQQEFYGDWDNYESNMYLDIEERQIQIDLSIDNTSSLNK